MSKKAGTQAKNATGPKRQRFVSPVPPPGYKYANHPLRPSKYTPIDALRYAAGTWSLPKPGPMTRSMRKREDEKPLHRPGDPRNNRFATQSSAKAASAAKSSTTSGSKGKIFQHDFSNSLAVQSTSGAAARGNEPSNDAERTPLACASSSANGGSSSNCLELPDDSEFQKATGRWPIESEQAFVHYVTEYPSLRDSRSASRAAFWRTLAHFPKRTISLA